MAHQRSHATAGGGVVVRVLGNQRPRHPGTSTRGASSQSRCAREYLGRIVDGATAVPAVVHLGRRTAPHRRPAGRLGDSARGRGVAGSGLHAGASARAPPSTHRRHCEQPAGARRGVARGRRRRYSVSGRGRTRRPGTGVGVLRAGFAVGSDGRAAAGDRTGVCRDRRASRATDRPRVRVLGDRGDDGAPDRDRSRPDPADAVHHAGRVGRHLEGIRCAPGRGHRAFPRRGRGSCRRRSPVAGRRAACYLPPLAPDVHASPVPAPRHRWNCLPSKCFRS